jgi:alpha-galactosidase
MTALILHFNESNSAHQQIGHPALRSTRFYRFLLAAVLAATVFFGSIPSGYGQSPGIAEKPYLCWSSCSQQTISSNFLTQANIEAQPDALLASGLQTHGFNYIYGFRMARKLRYQRSADSQHRDFPDVTAVVTHIHQNGQRAGIYWIPGVEQPAVAANSPILGTPYHIQDILTAPYTAGNAFGGSGTSPYHYKIDFTKPGAQGTSILS